MTGTIVKKLKKKKLRKMKPSDWVACIHQKMQRSLGRV